MVHSNSDACLPPGWTVKVKVRKNGHKDKFYFPPSSDQKFNSMVGVLRYLDKAKNKASLQSISNNSEDVTMKPTFSASSGQIPRDQQISRRASKRLAGIKADPPQDLKRTRAHRDLVKKPCEDETLIISKKSANRLPNDQDRQFNALNRPETVINADASLPTGWTVKVNVRKNGHKDKYYFPPSSEKKFNSMVGVLRYLDNAKNKANLQSSLNNSDDVTPKPTLSVSLGQNSGLHMISCSEQIPRRSKRLAGIKADQLKTTRANQDVVKQSGEGKTIVNADRSTNKLPNDQVKPFNALHGSEANFNNKSTDNTKQNNPTEKDCVRVLENGDKVVAKLDYRCECDSPLQVILTDPSIAFAVQTLTGETFETSKDTQISSELKSIQNCETSAKEHDCRII
ncbi:uncharacterized protein [Medicago truncatula]|uniref:uncharacterized protein isoform X2 n=1 Tax=Medicago truncatula TaxID=3880 RepID=UPI001967C689|nr:uncharacterized protein LOC11439235 isoform X2 [Medicago truncatula]